MRWFPRTPRPVACALVITLTPFALALAAAPAAAKTICVNTSGAGCDVTAATAADAFDDALDGDRIQLGELSENSPLADGGRRLAVAGAGEGVTLLAGGLTLSDAGSEVSAVTAGALDLAGTATRVTVDGTAELHGGALLRSAVVTDHIRAADGVSRLQTVALHLSAGPGLRVARAAELEARHVTVAGTPAAAVTTDCQDSEARVSDSILWAPFAGPGIVKTSYSDYPAAASHQDGPGDRHVDPAFAPGSLRLAPGSPLLDAGTPGPLAETEWPEDRDRLPRTADGDGDSNALRDPGAFETQPAAVPVPAGNLLRDHGAEEGGAWTAADGFTRERYGVFPFPSAATGAALGAGGMFFAGGSAAASSAATQLVDLTGFAPEIDRGVATASLAGLLGGYRADADGGRMEGRFLDPAGRTLGAPVALTAPAAAERANATTLLPRSRTDPIPPLARSLEITLRSVRATGGYGDAYFDNLAVTVSAPGAPLPPESGPGASPVKPFAGIRVLTGAATVDRRGRVALRLACVDGTVGRCSGVLTLAGALRRRSRPRPLAMASVSVAPGAIRRVHLPLNRRTRRAVRERRRIRMTLFAAVRDGQGLTRLTTVPVTVKWRKPPRQRRRR